MIILQKVNLPNALHFQEMFYVQKGQNAHDVFRLARSWTDLADYSKAKLEKVSVHDTKTPTTPIQMTSSDKSAHVLGAE